NLEISALPVTRRCGTVNDICQDQIAACQAVSESSALIAFYTAATDGWAQHRNRPMRPPLHQQFHIGSAIKHVPRETEPGRLTLNPKHLPPSDRRVPHDAR